MIYLFLLGTWMSSKRDFSNIDLLSIDNSWQMQYWKRITDFFTVGDNSPTVGP